MPPHGTVGWSRPAIPPMLQRQPATAAFRPAAVPVLLAATATVALWSQTPAPVNGQRPGFRGPNAGLAADDPSLPDTAIRAVTLALVNQRGKAKRTEVRIAGQPR